MDAPDRKALKLNLEQDALTGATTVFSDVVLQHQLKTNLSVSASISDQDVTLKDQINDHSSISFNVGKDHAMLNYQLTF